MRNIRMQLLLSHAILVALMVVVMTGAIFAFVRLGRSIDRILRDNYKSVIAAQDMKESLERIDSSATFFLAGQTQRAKDQFEAHVKKFRAAYNIEANNITEPGEKEIADSINLKFNLYAVAVKAMLQASPQMADSVARETYFTRLEPAFTELKKLSQSVLDLNQTAIRRADDRARLEAHWASWSGIGVTLAAFIIGLSFAFRMIGSTMLPLRSLTRQAEEIGAGHLNQRIELQRDDEIGGLAAAFNVMGEKLRAARDREEERLQRAERMSDAAIDSLFDPVIVTDGAARIVHLNRAAETLFGSAESASGKPVREVVTDHRIVTAIEAAVRGEVPSIAESEASNVKLETEGIERIYRLRAGPMRGDDGALLGAATVLEDVTHLHELDRLKTEFIAVASHELRTPVTSLLLSVQLMEEGALGTVTDAQREVINAQREDLERLDRMMRELLDITRLEAGLTPPKWETVAPLDILQAAEVSTQAAAEQAGLRLEIELGTNLANVRADRQQVVRALVNLLNNAIRHSLPGNSVTLAAQSAGSFVKFSVQDHGSGIDPEYLSSIFDKFVQVPGTTRGGAGLGLSIAKSIVETHGGEIGVESTPGEGSLFWFTMPVSDDLVEA